MSELVNLKIDGKPVAVPKGTLVVDAAERIGIEIPVFCYHPKMDPVGACRMCLVEIGTPRMGPDRKPVIDEKTGEPVIAMMPKLQTACTTPVSEGMVVLTRTQPAADGRRAVLEFLLTNHPLDCPVCDKGGECPLQDNTFKYGPDESRFVEPKRHFQKPIPLSDRIVLDRERCILCYRCVRFQSEIANDESLTVINRGSYSEIGVAPGKTFDSIFSGNTIELCPVGALTSSKYRFKARPWDLKHVPSICSKCSVGCNVTIDIRKNDIMRLLARENTPVDDGWLCDRGRFSFEEVHDPNRLTAPYVRRDGQLVPVGWPEAYQAAVARLRSYVATHGPESVAGIASPHYTNEELYLFGRLFREVIGSPLVDHWPRPHVAPVDPELDAVRGSIAGLETADAILLVGANPLMEQPILDLRLKKAVNKRRARLVVVHPDRIDLTEQARVWLQPRVGGEALVLAGLLRSVAALATGGQLPTGLAAGFEAATPELVERETGVPAAHLERAALLLAEAQRPALLYPREFPEDWRAGLAALTRLALARTPDEPTFVGGLVRFANSQGALDLRLLPTRAVARETAGGFAWANPIAEAIRAGRIKALWLLGATAFDPAAVDGVECLIVQDSLPSPLAARAHVLLAGAAFAEKEGTYTNLERRVQRLSAPKLAPGVARPDWRILIDVARALGAGYDYGAPRDVLREIARTYPAYADITWERIGLKGRQWTVRAAEPGAVAAD